MCNSPKRSASPPELFTPTMITVWVLEVTDFVILGTLIVIMAGRGDESIIAGTSDSGDMVSSIETKEPPCPPETPLSPEHPAGST